MDSRAAIVSSCWIAVAVISAMYVYVGGVTLETDIIVGILVFIAFIITFAVGFGFEAFRAELREKSPPSKTQMQISSELAEIKTTITELSSKVDSIQKELQE
jgi:hypothetical protein